MHGRSHQPTRALSGFGRVSTLCGWRNRDREEGGLAHLWRACFRAGLHAAPASRAHQHTPSDQSPSSRASFRALYGAKIDALEGEKQRSSFYVLTAASARGLEAPRDDGEDPRKIAGTVFSEPRGERPERRAARGNVESRRNAEHHQNLRRDVGVTPATSECFTKSFPRSSSAWPPASSSRSARTLTS